MCFLMVQVLWFLQNVAEPLARFFIRLPVDFSAIPPYLTKVCK